MNKILLLISTICLLVLSGCGKNFKLTAENKQIESAWPLFSKDLAGSGSYADGAFNGKLDIIWEKKVRDKLTGPLTLQYDFIVYAGARKKMKFFNINTGDYKGRIKDKNFSQTGMVISGDTGFYAIAPPVGRVQAVELVKGSLVWKKELSDIASGSIIVKDLLIVCSVEGVVYALNLSTGEIVWNYDCHSRLSAGPVVAGDILYQTVDKNKVIALSIENGSEVYQTVTEKTPVSSASVGKLLYCADIGGNVYGIDLYDGSILWLQNVGGACWSSPAVSDNKIFISHAGGEVVAFDALSGEIVWKFSTDQAMKARPILVNEVLVVATLRGEIFTLNAGDGTLIDRRDLGGAIEFSPVTDGTHIYAATQKGLLISLGENDGIRKQENH